MTMTKKTVAERIAQALLDIGSDDYTVRSGSIRTLMSKLAKEGELAGVSQAYLAYTAIVPADGRRLAEAVPAKILNQYIYIYRQRSDLAVKQWIKRTPEWPDRIKSALPSPELFERIVSELADEAIREN
jgi:hypothetical protein